MRRGASYLIWNARPGGERQHCCHPTCNGNICLTCADDCLPPVHARTHTSTHAPFLGWLKWQDMLQCWGRKDWLTDWLAGALWHLHIFDAWDHLSKCDCSLLGSSKNEGPAIRGPPATNLWPVFPAAWTTACHHKAFWHYSSEYTVMFSWFPLVLVATLQHCQIANLDLILESFTLQINIWRFSTTHHNSLVNCQVFSKIQKFNKHWHLSCRFASCQYLSLGDSGRGDK